MVLVQPVSKRRYRSKQERRQVVEDTLRPGASVAVIARRHGVNANQVFHWRKLYRDGDISERSHSASHISHAFIEDACNNQVTVISHSPLQPRFAM